MFIDSPGNNSYYLTFYGTTAYGPGAHTSALLDVTGGSATTPNQVVKSLNAKNTLVNEDLQVAFANRLFIPAIQPLGPDNATLH